MFRHSLRRAKGPNREFNKHSDKESSRMNNERRRRIIYDDKGNLNVGGLCYMLWEDFHQPVLIFASGLVLFYGYQRLIAYLSGDDDVRTANIDRLSEEQARASGKLKSERFLVKPSRQIDDPDFLDIPSFGGKNTHKSALFVDDDVSSNPLFSGKNRS